MQQKMSEVYAHSAETKGFMSTLLTYVFYAIAGQFVLGAAGYIYWKLRVERKDKKLL